MNTKALLYIVLALSVTTTVVIIVVYSILQIDPTILGYPPNEKDTSGLAGDEAETGNADSLKMISRNLDTIYIEPKITISKEEFDKYQQEILRKELLANEKDSLKKVKMALLDSINRIYAGIGKIRDSIGLVADTLSSVKNDYSVLNDTLDKYYSMYEKTQERLKLAEERIKDQENKIETRYDSLEIINFQNYAKIYNNTDPASVARILEQIDEQDASMILKFMQKRKAGKVLDAMVPEQAAAILLLGTESQQ